MTAELNLNTPPVKPKGNKPDVKIVSRIYLGPVSAEAYEMKVLKKLGAIELKLHIKDMPIHDVDGEDLKSTFGTVLEDGTIVDSTAGVLAYLIANDIPIVVSAMTAKITEEE